MTICKECGTEIELSATNAKRHDYRCSTCKNAYNRAWRAANPEKVRIQERNPKVRARNAVAYALRKGKIKRLPCEICGATTVHGHHDDYSKRLDVRWLCNPHHRAVHKGLLQ